MSSIRTYINNHGVGRTRRKLAKLLERKIPGATFEPGDLLRHAPIDIHWGLANWSGFGTLNDIRRSVCSWDSMSACLKSGDKLSISVSEGYAFWEVHAEK